MRKTRPFISNAPHELRKVRLDNIALVPASLLPFKETYQLVANALPQGTILCVQNANPRQRKILENVTAFFRTHHRRVITLPLERLHHKKQSHQCQAQTIRLAF